MTGPQPQGQSKNDERQIRDGGRIDMAVLSQRGADRGRDAWRVVNGWCDERRDR
jgi:hypothetical protein